MTTLSQWWAFRPQTRRHIVLDVDELTSLRPGHCLELRLKTGERYKIMNAEDATFVLERAGMTTTKRDCREPGSLT